MPDLTVRPITPARFADVEALFRTSAIVNACWDLWPRRTGAEAKAARPSASRNRAAFRALARRRRAPGLLAYRDGEAVGFISLGPRSDMRRVEASRATPRVDGVDAWVVPCLYVHPKHRGEGVAIALLRAAVNYAAKRGAAAVEGYPRADGDRVHDDFAFYGTVAMFRRAGFRKLSGPLSGLPTGWTPRWTMRATTAARRS